MTLDGRRSRATASSIEEARFLIERELVALADENGGSMPLVHDVRFFLYPHASHRLVLACAERADGGPDVEVLFELPAPVVGDDLDENAIREKFFDMPSGSRH
jgi:hypothetical protein